MTVPLLKPYLLHLLTLADLPFEFGKFRKAVCDFGWIITNEEPEDNFFWCKIPDEQFVLFVDCNLDPPTSPFASLQVFNWEDIPLCCDDSTSDEFLAFTAAFEDTRRQTAQLLGQPAKSGTYASGGYSFKYAQWLLGKAALIVHQEDYDPQFGANVTIWIKPCSPSISIAVPPFIM